MKYLSIKDFKHKIKVDKVIDKRYIKIGFSYSKKGPHYVWYRLSKNKISKGNILLRPYFYKEPELDKEYRVKYTDFINSGYVRGHIAPDASFDYDIERLQSIYTLANVVPQRPLLNRVCWLYAEKYARRMTKVFGYTYVINFILYNKRTIRNGFGVPELMYKVILNKKNGFRKILRYKNNDIITTLKDAEISLDRLLYELHAYKIGKLFKK